jgi:hypothetical protein
MTPKPTGDEQLCHLCVGEPFLRSEIAGRGRENVCSYCGRLEKCFSLDEVAGEVETTLKEHFYLTASEPSGMEYMMIKEGDLDWERDGRCIADVICDYAVLDSRPAEDVASILEARHYDFELAKMGEENPFGAEAQYAEQGVDDSESQAGWRHFEQSLKTETRYFSRAAEETLRSVFEGIAEHKIAGDRSTVVTAGPERDLGALYRARVFQSNAKLREALERPDKEIGPPPPSAATSGRMNAHGIAVFYGARDPLVALAEVRPPIGSTVVIGRFELVRPLQLLDIEALRSVEVTGSVFDRSYLGRLERRKFLGWLSRRVAMPVMPDDEPFEYLPTQVIADFLANEVNPSLDGLIYPSVYGGEGKSNIVLFHKAARVQSLDIPKGTEVEASLCDLTEDGPETNYWVWERVPPDVPAAASTPDDFPFSSEPLDAPPLYAEYDDREPALKLDIKNLEVHHVNKIDVSTEKHTVKRYRLEKRDLKF